MPQIEAKLPAGTTPGKWWRERAQRHVEEADLDLGVVAERAGLDDVEDRARLGDDLERAEAAAVARALGIGERLEGQLQRDLGALARGVVGAGLRRVVAQVDRELVGRDGQAELVDRAVVLLLLEIVGAGRQLPERGAGAAFAEIHVVGDGGEIGLGAVLLDELEHAAFADAKAGDPGPEIALEEVRQARVDVEDVEDRLVGHALGEELHRRDADALLEDLGRVGGHRAGHIAADIVPVRDVGDPGDKLAVGEDRRREHHVVEMRDAAVVGVVRGEDVARLDALERELLQDAFHRLVEHADEGGDAGAGRGDVAVGVEDRRCRGRAPRR